MNKKPIIKIDIFDDREWNDACPGFFHYLSWSFAIIDAVIVPITLSFVKEYYPDKLTTAMVQIAFVCIGLGLSILLLKISTFVIEDIKVINGLCMEKRLNKTKS